MSINHPLHLRADARRTTEVLREAQCPSDLIMVCMPFALSHPANVSRGTYRRLYLAMNLQSVLFHVVN